MFLGDEVAGGGDDAVLNVVKLQKNTSPNRKGAQYFSIYLI
jgi:hypothetical protein